MKLVKVMSFLCAMLISSVCFAGLKDYPPIAVLEFSKKAGVSDGLTLDDTNAVADYMVDELVDSDRFTVMEREQIKAIIDEHSLNNTGMVAPDTIVQIGRLTGVKYLVYGSITGLSLKESLIGYEDSVVGGAKNSKYTVIANISTRIIDIETGRIVLTGRGEGKSSSTGSEISLKSKYLNHTYSDTSTTTTTSTTSSLLSSSDSEDSSSTDGTTSTKEVIDKIETDTKSRTITIGVTKVSQIQVHNALSKAVHDAVYGGFGLLTKLDGKGKVVK